MSNLFDLRVEVEQVPADHADVFVVPLVPDLLGEQFRAQVVGHHLPAGLGRHRAERRIARRQLD